jgi:hypothetical protein
MNTELELPWDYINNGINYVCYDMCIQYQKDIIVYGCTHKPIWDSRWIFPELDSMIFGRGHHAFFKFYYKDVEPKDSLRKRPVLKVE